MAEQIKFEDADQYSYGMQDKITFRDIIMNYVRKIADLAAVEWHGGYNESRTKIADGGSLQINEQVYIEDSREKYSNAVEALSDLLAAHFDEEMHKAEQVCNTDKENALNRFHKAVAGKKDFDSNKIEYRTERQQINRRLFRELCKFLFRKRYLELGVIEDK